jgi:hypothetical protein
MNEKVKMPSLAPLVFSFGIGLDYTPGQCEKWIRVSRLRPGINIDESEYVIFNPLCGANRGASNDRGEKRFPLRHAKISCSGLGYYTAATPLLFLTLTRI